MTSKDVIPFGLKKKKKQKGVEFKEFSAGFCIKEASGAKPALDLEHFTLSMSDLDDSSAP